MKIIIAICIIFAGTSNCEELLWKQILTAPEAEQVAFVKSYIAQDLRNPASQLDEQRSGALSALMLNKGDTFIPLFAEVVESQMATEDPLSNGIGYRAVGFILTARSVLAMETLERLFRNDQVRFKRNMPPALLPDWGQGKKLTIAIWYKAFASSNPDLRAIAANSVQEIFARDIVLAHDYQALAEAMIAHYGHYPTDNDFQLDPVIGAIGLKDTARAGEAHRKVLEVMVHMRNEKPVEAGKR